MVNDFIIKMENTAISNNFSKSVEEVLRMEGINCSSEILDYGTGRMRNALHCIERGYKNTSVLDRKIVVDKFKIESINKVKKVYTPDNLPTCKFDLILCNYVLNVNPDVDDRHKIITNIYSLLKDYGVALFEVRHEKEIHKNAKYYEPYGDGLVMGTGRIRTFQKPWTNDSFKELLESFNFEVIEHIKGSSVAYVVRKTLAEQLCFNLDIA
jgi:SAM-dependent methyltransferase